MRGVVGCGRYAIGADDECRREAEHPLQVISWSPNGPTKGRVLSVQKVARSLRQRHKHSRSSVIGWDCSAGRRLTTFRRLRLVQVSEVSELKCYNRGFWQKKYAQPHVSLDRVSCY